MSERRVEPEQPEVEKWPRLGALAAIPGRDGAWSVWSRGSNWSGNRLVPIQRGDDRKWWLIPVDATEPERADQAVLLRDSEFGPYVPDETGVLW